MRREITVAAIVLLGLTALAASAGVGAAQDAEVDLETCDFPYEGPDGETVIEEEPETVAPGIAGVSQILWEIDAQEKVVGLTSNSFYLEDSEGYTDLGTTLGGGFEENVVAQDPDIVVNGLFEPEGLEETLESAGIEYYFLPQSGSFEEIKENVRLTGRLIGECEEAEDVVEDMEDTISNVENAVEGEQRPLVMFGAPTEEGNNYVPGEGTFKHDVITTAGGENVYARIGIEGELEQLLSDEKRVEALSEDPDWIVIESGGSVPNTDLYNQTTAVQEDQILTVNTNYINQDAPRIVTPLERMARAFHPEAFASEPDDGGSLPDPEDEGTGTVSSQLTVADNVSVAEFGSGAVEAIELNVGTEGDVTVSNVETGDAPGLALRRAVVTVPDDARDAGGSVRMSIDDATLEDSGVPAEDLVVVGLGDGWSALETTRFDTDDGVTLVAETPVFDEFAVVASTEPTPVVESSVENDETVTLDASGSSDEYGEIVSHRWDMGDETHEGETVEVTANNGDEVTLTVTNDAGLSATMTETVKLADEGETDEGTDGRGDEESETDDGSDGSSEEEETGENTQEDDTGDESQTSETGDEGDGGSEGLPGFTAVIALVAITAFVAVRAHR
jgi:iron complex transport system substrate-binding protein